MTKFFEVISVSATHIYHSALELSPLSSIVRRLYHHRYLTPSPRVVIGPEDSWQPSIAIPNKDCPYISCAWSPCGRFIAAQTQEVVEVRDPLTFELLSTLQPTKPTPQLTGPLAYSPDGCSLCCASNATIVIWDIQTGGLTKEIESNTIVDCPCSLVWSSDKRTIGAVLSDNYSWSVATWDVASGTTLRHTLISADKPYLWAHKESFRVMMTLRREKTKLGRDMAAPQYNVACTIYIFEVGVALTFVRSFNVSVQRGRDFRIGTFSPTFHHTSISVTGETKELVILDDLNRILFSVEGVFGSHCFSSDGQLFAASLDSSIHLWKFGGSHYSTWRTFPDQSWSFDDLRLLFSPNSSSILGHFADVLQVWRFDNHRATPVADSEHYVIISPNNTYIITAHPWGSTVTITNLASQTPPQFIDTDAPISGLALTGNVLVVVSSKTIMAWLLTEVGAVESVSGNRRVGHGDNIWVISPGWIRVTPPPEFSVVGYVGLIIFGVSRIFYHISTGERLEFISDVMTSRWYSLEDTSRGRYHLPCRNLNLRDDSDNREVPQTTFQEGWMKDPEGKHWLWLPVEWRTAAGYVEWSHHVPTLQVELPKGRFIAITFQ